MNKLIRETFSPELSMSAFQKIIEQRKTKSDLWSDVVIQYCNENSIDFEEIKDVMSPTLKSLVYQELLASGVARKQTEVLPYD